MTEQMELFKNSKKKWETEIQAVCETMVIKYKLPPKSIYIAQNMGRDGKEDKRNQIISYSICIYEPEYPETKNKSLDPTRNTVVMNIKFNELKTKTWVQLLVKDSAIKVIGGIDGTIDNGPLKGTYFHKFQFDLKDMDVELGIWKAYVEKLIEYELSHYISKAAAFGCCSHFIECSDAKECVHANKLYACSCYYKHHLDEGNIYYGKNKNID